MSERDQIFRERLVAVVSDLHGGESGDRQLRRTVGSYAGRMAREAGARNWADLKERADGSTYDSMLQLFQKQSEAANQAGDENTVRAFEILAISVIARRQYQADLVPGVTFLDRFIETCETAARRANAQFVPMARRRT